MIDYSSKFNNNLEEWKAYQAAPWGQLRHTVVQKNLQRHLNIPPQQILDVGGGNGVEAIALANLGHQVTTVDYADAMLEDAREMAAEHGVADQITCRQLDVLQLDTFIPNQSFDVVLCHNVVQYVEDVETLFQQIHATLKPGGWLSLISINPYSEAYIAALREFDLEKSTQKLGTRYKESATIFGGIGHPLYTAEEMSSALAKQKFSVKKQYGLRCLLDYIADEDLKHQPKFYAQIEELEQRLTDTYPYNLLARNYQLVAYKS